MDTAQGLDIFSKITATGALIWVVWFTLSRTIPNLIDKFTADQAAARTAFLCELKDARTTFEAQMTAQREDCRQEVARIIDLHAQK
jgi:hypothetical protein